MINYFRKNLNLQGCLYEDFHPELKFQLIKSWWDFISHDKREQCENWIAIICKNFITVKQAEISSRFEQTELNFHSTGWKWLM